MIEISIGNEPIVVIVIDTENNCDSNGFRMKMEH
jgi:hypothetical protein